MIKGSVYQEEKPIISMYGPNIRPPKYIKLVLTYMKRGKDNKQ